MGKSKLGMRVLAIFAMMATCHAGFLKKYAIVYVDSIASPAYEERRESRLETGNLTETYTFAEGKFFPGEMNDKSLHEVSFDEIIASLSTNMKERGFVSASSPEKSDLFIVVHWGATAPEEDWSYLTGFDPADVTGTSSSGPSSEPSFMSTVNPNVDFYDYETHTDDAKLLGMHRHMKFDAPKTSGDEMLEELLDYRRYFIILMAYDMRHLRDTKEGQLLWSTRFNLDSGGTDFREAYHALAKAASPYYGVQLDKPKNHRTDLGPGEVTPGELEVVQEGEESVSRGQ